MRLMLLAALAAMLLPAAAPAETAYVDVETLIASPAGTYYVIIQETGEVDLVRRGEDNPPARSRTGKARPKMQQLRTGATAAEMARATGLTRGIEPEPGDAVIGSTQLRDPLDELHVFDDGSGFVARYSSSPSKYDDLQPVRAPDGADEGLAQVEVKPVGADRRPASFVHVYTRKDVVFWGDPQRKLVMMVAGGTELAADVERGVHLADRESGERPRVVAWSYESGETIEPPFEALLDRARSADPAAGMVAFLLARELDLAKTVQALRSAVLDPTVPHPTRLHIAAALHAEGDGLGDPVILDTAWGKDRPGPLEARLELTDTPGETGVIVRSWAISILPITHPDAAPGVLFSLVDDLKVGSVANGALIEGPWPEPGWTGSAAVQTAGDLSRPEAQRSAAARLLASLAPLEDAKAPESHPLWGALAWLAADEDPQVAKPILTAVPALSDDVQVPRLAERLRGGTPSERADAAYHLARRSWRSPVARDLLVATAGDPDDDAGAAAALGSLWAVDDERVKAVVVQRSASGGAVGDAALHSLFITARRTDSPELWVAEIARIPAPTSALAAPLRRLVFVLDPKRVVWPQD